jgi:hypothetical protein
VTCVEVVYDTSPGLLQEQPAVVRCWRDKGSSTLKEDEHGGLRGLGR